MSRVLILLFVPGLAWAQKQNHSFRVPAGANSDHYAKSHVLVKVKKEYQYLYIDSPNTNPIPTIAKSVKPLVNRNQLKKAQARLAPRLTHSKIDLAHYLEIGFAGGDVEVFINRLYATGHFELVEPDYTAQLHFNPNDEFVSNQYYLTKIRAFEAWDISKGKGDLIIGIVDSGGDLDHPDLAEKIFVDPADPIDNIDNDNDGYVDNNRGWDFMGGDTLNVTNPNFVGDNNPNNPNGNLGSHATAVAGCAAATTNNSVGIAGVGFNTRIMFTKHHADNQGANRGTIYRGYSGILYAATHGAKIINCSWGGPFRSQIQQDLISYVTLDLGCLVVAAAGNNSANEPSYPGGYDYVLSVAASDQNDTRASFSNYHDTVDITAPGKGIRTTFFNDVYNTVDGTSFSSPITAGAAALLWSHQPTLTAVQLAQQLRVTANPSIYNNLSSAFANKMGKGVLDIVSALTQQFPSVRASNPKFVNAQGTVAEPGQEGFLSMDFTNILAPSTSGLKITVTSVGGGSVNLTNNTIFPGQLGTNQTINNKLNPVSMKVSAGAATNTIIDLLITFTDGQYSDYQHLSFIVNPSFIDVDDNQILTTLASNGRIGFENTSEQTNGSGFVVSNNKLLFEMGLIMGTSAATIFNNVRSTNGLFDDDFGVDQKIKEISPGERSFSEIFGKINDKGSTKSVAIDYRSLVWKEEPYDRFVILEYKVKNISAQSMEGFHFALFADWDITDQGGKDMAKWDSNLNLGYVHPAQADDKPYAGIKLLKGTAPEYFAIDNNQSIPGTPFGLYDGYTDAEKFQSISSGIGRTTAGTASATGNDVSHVLGAGPYNIASDGEITVAFALVTGANLSELQFAAAQADTVYNFMLTATKPTVPDVATCYGSGATLNATGASQFKWYKNFVGGEPIYSGPSFITGNLKNDTVFFVSNADQRYESVRTVAGVHLKANPTILASGSSTICDGTKLTLFVAQADEYTWSTGATTQNIEVTQAGNYSVNVVDNTLSCNSSSSVFSVVVNPSPVSKFQVEGELKTLSLISFVNTSTGAIAYTWTFGDGLTSTDQSPSHTYSLMKDYMVLLVATNTLGCTSTSTQTISVITDIDDAMLQLYPNPVTETLILQSSAERLDYSITDLTGRKLKSSFLIFESGPQLIDLSDLPPGLYLLNLSGGKTNTTRKLLKL